MRARQICEDSGSVFQFFETVKVNKILKVFQIILRQHEYFDILYKIYFNNVVIIHKKNNRFYKNIQ